MSLFQHTRRQLLTSRHFLRTFLTTPILRSTNASSSESIILPRLQTDLKLALRAKDKPRLTVLRSLMAEITNASKTPKPITSDASLLSLLNKQIKAANAAIDEFTAAKRDDLVKKERTQLDVLQGYANEIPKVSMEEIDRLIAETLEKAKEDGEKVAFGPIMGKVKGVLGGRAHDVQYVQDKVQELVGSK